MTTKSNYIFQEEYIIKTSDEEIDEKEADTKYISTLFGDMDTQQLLTIFSNPIKAISEIQLQELRRTSKKDYNNPKKKNQKNSLKMEENIKIFFITTPLSTGSPPYKTYSEQLKTYQEETEKKQKKESRNTF